MKIILSVAVVTALVLGGCSQEKQDKKEELVVKKSEVVKTPKNDEIATPVVESPSVVDEAVTAVADTTAKAVDTTSDVVSEATTKVVDGANEVVAVVTDTTAKVIDGTSDVVSDTTSNLAEATSGILDTASNVVASTAKVVTEVVSVEKIDAVALYKGCIGCHGANAQKKALGKSKVIKGWSVEQTTVALKGYKDGSYGGSMKAMMKGQVKKFSDKDIEALAEYISKL